MKVYNGVVMAPRAWPFRSNQGQARVDVRAKSRAAAGRALESAGVRVSSTWLKDHLTETGNAETLALMEDQPDGTVITSPLQGPGHEVVS
jgi:hypothetical protein